MGSGFRAPRWLSLLGAASGIVALAIYWYPLNFRILHGINDFLSFYGGGRLMGTPLQYDAAAYRNLQGQLTGYTGDAWLFIRLPAFALPFALLSRLPFQTAYTIWQVLCIAALAAFVALWPKERRLWVLVALCWSFPLSSAFVNGQDDAFLLLWIVLAIRFSEKKPRFAGAILALCSMKFHLFLLLPIALIARRKWTVLGAFACSAVAIFALCFVVAGPHWISSFLNAVLNPATNPHDGSMPNLHGLVASLPRPNLLEALLCISVAAGVWRVAARNDFSTGLSTAILGGLLVSHHDYLADLVLLVPAIAIFRDRFPTSAVQLTTGLLLLPLWYVLPEPRMIPAFMIALLFFVVREGAALQPELCREAALSLAA